MSETIGGLLDDAWKGWTGFWDPQEVPAGAAYDAQSLGMARANAFGNLGGTLLALAQGGVSPETRARLLAGLGDAPLTYQQSLLAGGDARLKAAQIRKLDTENESQKAFGTMVDDIIRGRGTEGKATPGGVTPGNLTGSPARLALAALKGPESGGKADAVNSAGYSGLFQIGTGLASSAGLYKPAQDEAVTDDKGRAVNAWRGQWVIPGFEPMTHQQWLANPAAQQRAGEIAMEHNWSAIQQAGLDKYVGQTVGGVTITPQALLQGAWMGGVKGLQTWLSGQGDPQDSNKASVSRWAGLTTPGTMTDAGAPAMVPTGSGGAPAAPGEGRRSRGDLTQLTTQQLTLLKTMTPAERAQWLLQQSNKIVPTPLTAQEKQSYGLDPGSVYVWDENGKPSKLQDSRAQDLSPDEKVRLGFAPNAVVQRKSDGTYTVAKEGQAEELSPAEKARLGYPSDAVVQRKSDGTYTVVREGQAKRLSPEELAAEKLPSDAIAERTPDGKLHVIRQGLARRLTAEELKAGNYAPDSVVERLPDGTERVVQASQAQQAGQNLFSNARETRQQIESGPVYTNYSQAKPQLMLIRQAAPVGNGASDMAMIYAYAKILDPNSVVRGPEGDMVQRTGGVWDTIQGMVQMVKGDGKLSPTVRRQLVEQAESVFHAHEVGMQARVDTYRDLAKANGLDPDKVYPEIKPMSSYAERKIKPLPGNQPVDVFVAGLKSQLKADPTKKAAVQALMNEHGLDLKLLD
jgi:hypothetical protein